MLLQRWILLTPLAIMIVYVAGHILMKHPSDPTEVFKKAFFTGEKPESTEINARESLMVPKTKSSVTVLAITNKQYADLTKNWLRSIETLHIYPNITIITTDSDAYIELSQVAELKFVQDILIASKSWMENYRTYMHFRWKLVLDLLHQKQDVLMSDVDMVWLENPFPYFSDTQYDMFVSLDPLSKLSTGMIFLRSKESTFQFVKELISRLSLQEDSSDAKILNFMIETEVVHNLKYHVLDPLQFVSGKFDFNHEWMTSKLSPVVVHAHGMGVTSNDVDDQRLHDVKVEHLKQHGMWYLQGNAKLTWKAGTASIQL